MGGVERGDGPQLIGYGCRCSLSTPKSIRGKHIIMCVRERKKINMWSAQINECMGKVWVSTTITVNCISA